MYAQDLKQVAIQNYNQCNNELFNKFRNAYVSVTGHDLEVDEFVRNDFITHMAIPESEKFNEYAMYSMASVVYVILEYAALRVHKTFDFKISNIAESSEWKVLSKSFGTWIQENEKMMKSIQGRFGKAQTNSLNATELRTLQNEYRQAASHKIKMDELLKKYEAKPYAMRIKAYSWYWSMVAVQGLLLAGYIIWLHEIGHSINGKIGNSPVDYEDLRKSKSTFEFQRVLALMDVEAIKKLYLGCRRSLGMDMENWIRAVVKVNAGDVKFAKEIFKTASQK